MATGRHVPRRRHRALLLTLGAVAVTVLVVVGGAAYAAVRYERAHADRILPGVTIGGLDVSGMTRSEATAAVRAAAARTLSTSLSISVGGRHWDVTAKDLGRRAAVGSAVRQALGAGSELGTFDRAWHRVRNESLSRQIPLSYETQGDGIDSLVSSIAKRVAVEPRNAAITIASDGNDIAFVRPKAGAKLDVAQAQARIAAALDAGRSTVALSTRAVAPPVTENNMGRTIVVRVNENRLYLYDGYDVVHTYSVATAKPGFTTPDGDWTIYDMKKDPTWYNPAQDGWGAGLPAVIPGGPGNPMGPRALYITAPGLIRIHGTTDDASIGRYASHGCIRMHNEEVIALYDMVHVGDHVIVVGTRPASAGYWSVPPGSDI
jgi:lipoprotein-anchoring transpeptidase ErfK/SrfK